jgi:AhpC/TSA family.
MTGKRIIKLAIGLLFLVLIGWIVIEAMSKESPVVIEYISAIPDIKLINTYYDTVSLDSLAQGAKHYIFVFYSPGCMFCEHEAADLSRNRAEFRDSKVLFITQEPVDSAMVYGIRYRLISVDNFYILADTTKSVLPRFGIKAIPTTLIYNEERKFVTSFEGEVNAKRILKILSGE